MIRTCDGTDPNLAGEDGEPCACGMTFDDVRRRVVWPHEPVNAAADLAPHELAIRRALELAIASTADREIAAPYTAALAILDDLKGPARTSLVTVSLEDLQSVIVTRSGWEDARSRLAAAAGVPPSVVDAIVAAERARRDAEPAPVCRPVPEFPGEALGALSEGGAS